MKPENGCPYFPLFPLLPLIAVYLGVPVTAILVGYALLGKSLGLALKSELP